MAGHTEPYVPLNTLKPFGEGIWIVDGPSIDFRLGGISLPFPTRMTVVRLKDGRLWVHSPTELTDGLKEEVDALGAVAFLVAPNKIHYWWIGDWMRAYPQAASYAAPRVEERSVPDRGTRFDHELTDETEGAWRDEMDQCLVEGRVLSEAVFFHRASKTLIVTDLIENFEAGRVRGPLMRVLFRLGGVMAPHGGTPRDMRLTFSGRKAHIKEQVEQMIGWEPQKIVLAHGRCIEKDAAGFLRHSFRWAGLR